ncbi:unnamed protein product [Amoebophrya sp. A25]|nr:unnamed protein product [Amoebophrya sp. A25]|eukprot:GSA25T00003836001.1
MPETIGLSSSSVSGYKNAAEKYSVPRSSFAGAGQLEAGLCLNAGPGVSIAPGGSGLCLNAGPGVSIASIGSSPQLLSRNPPSDFLTPAEVGGTSSTEVGDDGAVVETTTTRRRPTAGCDGVMCFLGCLMAVPGVKHTIVNKVAFFPPRPAGYFMKREASTSSSGGPFTEKVVLGITSKIGVPILEPLPDLRNFGIEVEHLKLSTVTGNCIHGFYFKKAAAKKTVIFSHGNSTDIGLMFFHLKDIAYKCDVSVLAYDYSGYGLSTGEPSERALYSDIQAVYYHLAEERRISPRDIVLYGQSVGSAPTIDLASQLSHAVGGVILHSAIKSGLSVIYAQAQSSPWYDVFQNVNKIKDVECPVFCIHGTDDQEVPIDHGKALFEACRRPATPWWVYHGGHNDIEVVWRASFFTKVRQFLENLE